MQPRTRSPRQTLTAAVLCGGILMAEAFFPVDPAAAVYAAEYDRPAEHPHQSRSVVIAEHGMVATSHPLAVQAGVEILRQGGTAADAAVAANAMLGVVEPMSCGIGGDLFVLYWDSKTRTLYGLNASGRSPYALTRDVFEERGLSEIPLEGPLPWSVPGCVDGWHRLHERFGRLPLKTLLDRAIETADGGFPVSEVIGRAWKSSEKTLAKWPDSKKTWLPGGHAPEVGVLFRNPNLAATYRLIAENGRDAFYTGPIAERIDDFSRSVGGFLRKKDLADHTSEWVEPVSTTYRGHEVWELPPNGQGIAALEMLNVLEGYDLKSLGRHAPEYLHLFAEAKKLAFADRARFYADPAFADLPVDELISKAYAARQRKRIDADRAATDVSAGDPRLQSGDTVYISVVDAERNCCSFIQSNYFGFGSQVTPGDLGFVLQNRGALFALDEKHLNRLEPHKRPFHTIIPAMVTRKVGTGPAGGTRRPWFCFGVMGGDMQPQGHVQVLVDMIDFGLNVQMAGDAARVRHVGSQTPTGRPMDPDGGWLAVESGIPAETIDALRTKGHRVVRAPGLFGGYQGIRIDWEHGTLHGGSDPRKDGCALGY